MRVFVRLALLALGPALSATAQSACPAGKLEESARAVHTLRHKLHTLPVSETEAVVPPRVAEQLQALKAALARSARAAFACAPAAALPEQLQTTLADALHANLPLGTEAAAPKGGEEPGTYGEDLAVQVFQLFGKPKLFEVDFRFGIACGDDHLLMVFETASDAATDGWHESLQWEAPRYTNVEGALGDFALLTPVTLNHDKPSWHYLVAHGHPGCGETPRPSRFDLDLLTPTADPARPTVTWHFEHPYTEGASAPRLATTEDTIEFRLNPQTPADAQGKATPQASQAATIYRFHLTASGTVEPSPTDAENEGSNRTSTKAAAVTTH